MKKMTQWAKVSSKLGLVALAGIASPCASAEHSGWYGGFSIGQARSDIDDVRITSGLLGGGFVTTSITDNDRDLGYKIYGGYQFNHNFALESGYFDLGEFSFTTNTLPPGTFSGNIKLKGANFDLVGLLPITQNFSALGRIGVNYAQAKDHFSGTGAVVVPNPDRKKTTASYKFGIGLQYALTDSLGLRAEAERYRIDDAFGNKGDIDLITAGLVFRFGATSAMAKVAMAPEPVASPPPPVAAVIPPPTPPPPRVPTKISLSADSLFDFNSATVKPSGKTALDTLVTDLDGTRFEVISITGHTDRLGTRAYNQRLSAQRAEAVKNYMVQSAGIPASKIETRGVAETEPVTKAGECPSTSTANRSPALIACLQPDRRVEVEVRATR